MRGFPKVGVLVPQIIQVMDDQFGIETYGLRILPF